MRKTLFILGFASLCALHITMVKAQSQGTWFFNGTNVQTNVPSWGVRINSNNLTDSGNNKYVTSTSATVATTTISTQGTTITGPSFTFATSGPLVSITGSGQTITFTSVPTSTILAGTLTTSTITVGGVVTSTLNIGLGLTFSPTGTLGLSSLLISQFTNDNGYVRSSSLSGIPPIIYASTGSISLPNIGATSTCTNATLTVTANGLVSSCSNGSASGGIATSTPLTAGQILFANGDPNIASNANFTINTSTGVLAAPTGSFKGPIITSSSLSIGSSSIVGSLNVVNTTSGLPSLVVSTTTLPSSTFILQVSNNATNTWLPNLNMNLFAVSTSGIPFLDGTTTVPIGGAALTNSCTSTPTMIPVLLSTTTDQANATPQTPPGGITSWQAYISRVGATSSDITTEVCEPGVSLTPTASKYQISWWRTIGN